MTPLTKAKLLDRLKADPRFKPAPTAKAVVIVGSKSSQEEESHADHVSNADRDRG